MARQKNIEQLWHFEEEDKIREKSMQVGKLQRKLYPNCKTPTITTENHWTSAVENQVNDGNYILWEKF